MFGWKLKKNSLKIPQIVKSELLLAHAMLWVDVAIAIRVNVANWI